jgi:hypothetical protein
VETLQAVNTGHPFFCDWAKQGSWVCLKLDYHLAHHFGTKEDYKWILQLCPLPMHLVKEHKKSGPPDVFPWPVCTQLGIKVKSVTSFPCGPGALYRNEHSRQGSLVPR